MERSRVLRLRRQHSAEKLGGLCLDLGAWQCWIACDVTIGLDAGRRSGPWLGLLAGAWTAKGSHQSSRSSAHQRERIERRDVWIARVLVVEVRHCFDVIGM